MSDALAGYRRTHGGEGLPLPLIQAHVRARGAPDAAGVRELAAGTHLPEAAVRSALSYYTDLAHPEGGPRWCEGTSCMLNGARSVGDCLRDLPGSRPVYCLGYCDRAPAVLRGDNRVVAPCGPGPAGLDLVKRATPPPALHPPSICCLAPQPIVTRRIIRGDFSSLDEARRDGAYATLERVRARSPASVLDAMERSGERGRGGAAFLTAAKWRACAAAAGPQRYVIANGDEGDPGAFIDRVLMEQDPHALLEGLAICAYAVGAGEAIVFVRCEYPAAIAVLDRAIAEATAAGVLGDLRVSLVPGLGSYVCGEETALINAIEGLRGEVRLRPPYPTEAGLHGRPTVVNNVETLVNVPFILEHGPDAYAALGTRACPGTKAMCLNAGFERPGIVEVEFGHPLRALIEEDAGGGRDGARLEAVILGGPMGNLLAPQEWDVPICPVAMSRRGIQLGHGGIVALPEGTDFRALLVHWLQFMQHESCGKCVPCRIGSQQALDEARRLGVQGGGGRAAILRLLEIMAEASLCAFGQQMPRPMQQMIDRFGERIFAGPGATGNPA